MSSPCSPAYPKTNLQCANLQSVWPVQSFYYSSSQCWIVSQGAVKQSERKQTGKPRAWNRVHMRKFHWLLLVYTSSLRNSPSTNVTHTLEENRRFKITYFLEKTFWSSGSAGEFWSPQDKCFQIPIWHSGVPNTHAGISVSTFQCQEVWSRNFSKTKTKNHSNSGERYSSKSKTVANGEEYMDLWGFFYKICCFHKVCCFKDLFLWAK